MSRKIILVLVAVPAVLCGVAISRVFGADARLEPLQEMARMRPARAFAARISIPTTYQTCTATPPPAGDTLRTVTTETCGNPAEGDLPLRELADAGQSTDPDLLRASGLAAIIWPGKKNEQVYADAIARLEKALKLSTRRVPLLVDLSAAHLVRAEREQQSYELAQAVEYAQRALELDPRNPLALFNAALATQALGLDEEAALAWDAYLAVDSTSPWAEEAQRRKDLLTRAPNISAPSPGASRPEVDAFAARWPQEAREYGFNKVLGDWGAAVAGGDSAACTEALLNLAGQLGNALARRPGGDASLADAVSAIRAARSDPVATMALARTHRYYAVGEAQFREVKPEATFAALNPVVRARPPSRVLLQWTALWRAGMRHYSGDSRGGERELRELLAAVDSAHHPALAGRARMMLGSMLLKGGSAEASEQFARAAQHFIRAGEAELAGTILSRRGEAAYQTGDTREAYRSHHRAQQALRSYRRSIELHNNLHALARSTVLDGMPRAALIILNEDLRVAQRLGTPARVVDALQARARARTIINDTDGAARDLDSILALLPKFPNEELHQDWGRAVIQVSSLGNVSAGQMDAAVKSFSQNVIWLVPALLRRAEVHLRAGRLADATKDLETVVAGIGVPSKQPGDALRHGALLEQARSSFDKLVMLYLRQGRPADALRALERGRLSFATQRDSAASVRDHRLTAAAGQTALDYAFIGDTLVIWTIRADTIRVFGRPVDRDAFMLTVEQVNTALQSRAPTADTTAGLQRLYDWLIRPVRGYLGPQDSSLVIVADGEVAGVPFAALLDSVSRQRLVHGHPIRFAATLADASRPASGRNRSGPALLVADPAFDARQYPGLYPLDSARAEVRLLSNLYGAAVLEGESATRDAFVERMRRASLVHYAGHAVFDEARPERSYLVLTGAGTTGRLTAEALSAMRLDGVGLVVLSACGTLRSREGRSGGFAGFSGALLSAGAGGVVGSLWQVNDQLTRDLMVAFHRHYRHSGDPARALRQAQLDMMAKDDPRLSSPAAWAGFRYTGAERP